MMNVKRLPSRLETLKLSDELDRLLGGCILSNFYQDRPHQISLLKVSSPTGPIRLVYQHGVRFHRTNYAYPFAKQPDRIVSGLRTVIRGAKITAVSQHAFDRVVKIALMSKKAPLDMFLEVMAGGVLAVTDDRGEILYTTERKRMKDREIAIGLPYSPPPSKFPSPFSITDRELEAFSAISGTVSKVLETTFGLGNMAYDVCFSLEVDPTSDWAALKQKEQQSLIRKGAEIALSLTPRPTLYLSNGEPNDYSLVPLKTPPSADSYSFDSISELMDAYYTWSGRLSMPSKRESDPKLEAMKTSSESLRLSSERTKEIASLIMANPLPFEKALSLSKQGKVGPVEEGIELLKIDYDRGMVALVVHGKEFQMDRTASALSNASRLFDLSKELFTKSLELDFQIDRYRGPEEQIEAIRLTRLKERPWYDKFRWAILSTGRMALLGKDAHSNEVLLRKYSNENDIIVHSQMPGSPFGLVWLRGEADESEIDEVANLVASYTSKAWESGFSSLDVFWVRRSQLRKAPPSGTFLPRGSFAVSGKRNYIRGARLGIGLAARKLNNDVEFLALSLKATSNFLSYAVLKPGDEPNSKVAHRLGALFARSLAMEPTRSLADSIRSKIPNKGSSIAELVNLQG